MTTNQLTLIDPALIDPNPYQPGTRLEFTPENLADLESIREKLLQPFIVRPHPDAAGRYQQSFGHRRLAAWKLYRFGEPIPCYVEDLEDLDDRAMFRQMVLENEQRLDTNSIEKALTLQAYIQAFGVTQAEAGQLYGLRTQSAVSNLLRLLQLPDPIQAYVAAGEVPERLARLLIPIARIFPQDAARIAQAIAQAEGNNKQMAGEEGIEHLLRQRGRPLWAAVWEPEWPTVPMSTDMLGGHPSLSSVPACKGCEFFFNRDKAQLCARPECFDAKLHLWILRNVMPKVSAALGIPVAQPGEKVQIVFAGHTWRDRDKKEPVARLALQTKHASLRLVAWLKRGDYSLESSRHNLLGSKHVALATVDLKALKKAVAAVAPKPRETKTKPPLTWQEKQKARQAKEQALRARRTELVARAAPTFAQALPNAPKALDFLAQALTQTVFDFRDSKLKEAVLRAKTSAQKRQAFAQMLLDETAFEKDLSEARDWINETAKALKLKLPLGWDEAFWMSADGKKPAKKKK